jgi:hydroxymethylbilane synthase
MKETCSSYSAARPLRIGTRGSALARVQTDMFVAALRVACPEFEAQGAVEIIPIRASGDFDPTTGRGDEPLYHRGGKGLFTHELELALDAGQIDVAVHSMKDVPTFLPDDFTIAAVLPREDPRDVFISPVAASPDKLPNGAVVGTSSPRRHAQVLQRWPHLTVAPLRGNVDTRLRKLEEGQVQATFLAYAGLRRLGLSEKVTRVMDEAEMLPCAAQGIIGFEIRKADEEIVQLLKRINHKETFIAMQAERALLAVLDGSCQTPIGALAKLKGDTLHLSGLVVHPEGKGMWEVSGEGSPGDPEGLGTQLGHKLREQTPPGILPGKP